MTLEQIEELKQKFCTQGNDCDGYCNHCNVDEFMRILRIEWQLQEMRSYANTKGQTTRLPESSLQSNGC